MKKILFLFLFGFLLTNLHAQRGRVQIQNGTIVTDQGTLLRGAFVALDNQWNEMPTREEVAAIKEFGLNTIHVYAENPWDVNSTGAGYNVNLMDSLVNWTATDSTYLILTMAGWTPEVDSFLIKFWSFYANRYKNNTHVLFEICNEPFSSPPYDSIVLSMEQRAYDTIRHYAPETHILLMSPWQIYDTLTIDVEKLTDIDWSNASLAAHGYMIPSQDQADRIENIKNDGYAITITEFLSFNKHTLANLACTRAYEQEFVSYCHFIEVSELVTNPAVYKTRIENSELRWTPDFGTWPLNIAQTNYFNPYEAWIAGFYDEGAGWIYQNESTVLGYIDDGDYAAYYHLDFENGPDSVQFYCSSDGYAGIIELHLDSISGQKVGECAVSSTGDWDTFEWFKGSIDIPFSGIHNLYLVFRDGGYNVRLIQFYESDISSVEFNTFDKQDILFYPNPAHDQITVNTIEKASSEIYNLQGRLLIQKEIPAYDNTIPVDDLPPGSYVVRILTNHRIHSEILIIE